MLVRPLVLTLTLTLTPGVLSAVFLGVVQGTEKCQQKCRDTFSPHTNQQPRSEIGLDEATISRASISENGITWDERDPKELNSCLTGCRLFSIIETVDNNNDIDIEQNMKSHAENCGKSCEKSFAESAESKSCNMGCKFQVPFAKERRTELSKPVESHLSSSLPVLHRIQIGIPRMENIGMPSFFGSDPDFEGLFGQMQSRMNDMMSRMMQTMKGIDMKDMPAGTGQLTVIQSGPGYHQEKTYNFGPKGIQEENQDEVDEEEKEKMLDDDMMDKPNPLERGDTSDVEIMDSPSNPTPKLQSGSFWDEMSRVRKQLEQQIQEMVNSDPDEYRNSATVHGFDFDDNIEPKMSEGLRPGVRYVTKEQFCAQNSENMRWSDWVSCLHLRMGLPRWLTAATLSLGIIFIIWLCLVIPHSAPKQKVIKMPADLTKTNLSILDATPIHTKDSPPAYDEIPGLHVAIPAEQAPPLPEKKPIDHIKA